jgi:four helix bundle protein
MNGSSSKDFELKDQINRSSGSIMDNMAEGFERDGTKEFILFLGYAKGSCGYARSQCYRASDKGHIDTVTLEDLRNDLLEISRMIKGLINYLKGTDIKGHKFRGTGKLLRRRYRLIRVVTSCDNY